MTVFPTACLALLPVLLPRTAVGLSFQAAGAAHADAEAAAAQLRAAGGASGSWFRARRGRRHRKKKEEEEEVVLSEGISLDTEGEAQEQQTLATDPPLSESTLSAAYCVHGLIRGFTNPLVWQSILDKVVAPEKGNIDLFFYLKYSTEKERSDAEAIAREMNATRVQMLPAGDAGVNQSCHGGRAAQFDAVFTDLEHCFGLIEEEEALRGRRYDFVGKLRADEELCKAFPALEQMSRRAVMVWDMPGVVDGGEVSDHVAVMPRDLASYYFHAVKELLECHPRSEYDTFCLRRPPGARPHKDEGVSPECFLGQALARENILVDLSTLGEGTYCIWHDTAAPAKCKLGGVFAQLYRADYTPASCKG